MVLYIAKQIEDGKVSYALVFKSKMWKPYKEDVDAILIADGNQDMIVAVD